MLLETDSTKLCTEGSENARNDVKWFPMPSGSHLNVFFALSSNDANIVLTSPLETIVIKPKGATTRTVFFERWTQDLLSSLIDSYQDITSIGNSSVISLPFLLYDVFIARVCVYCALSWGIAFLGVIFILYTASFGLTFVNLLLFHSWQIKKLFLKIILSLFDAPFIGT